MFLPTGQLFWKAAILAEGSSGIDSFGGALYRRFTMSENSSQHGAHAVLRRITEKPNTKKLGRSFGNRLKK
jgi:hypothetical protein